MIEGPAFRIHDSFRMVGPHPRRAHDVTRSEKESECSLVIHHEPVADAQVIEYLAVKLNNLAERTFDVAAVIIEDLVGDLRPFESKIIRDGRTADPVFKDRKLLTGTVQGNLMRSVSCDRILQLGSSVSEILTKFTILPGNQSP